MQIKDYKCKCGHNDFFFVDKGSKKGIYCTYCGKWVKWANKNEQNLAMKQEPSGDSISRQAVLEMAYDVSEIDGEHFTEPCMVVDVEDIQKLPTVTPQQKTGHWIEKDGKEQGYDIAGIKTWYIQIMCDKCGFIKTAIEGHTGHYNYCPNCGAKMQESEE